MVMPKQATEKCSWGLHCPICKNEEEHEEDRDNNEQNQPRMCPPKIFRPQTQNLQHPQPQNVQHPQLQNSQQSFEVPNRYAEQIKLREEWEERINRLNKKSQSQILIPILNQIIDMNISMKLSYEQFL